MAIDLHTHSTASDGTDMPADLMAKAAAAGVTVLALTDHDSTAGWAEAAAARPPGLTLIRGTEFSCRFNYSSEHSISLHLLGYLFDPDHEALRSERARLRESRLGRGEAIVDKLVADGVPITWERVRQLAGTGAVGRPHIARALVEQGVVPDVDAAFAQYLSDDSKYHVRKADSSVLDIVRLIALAGGVSVFAHPFARLRGPVVDEAVIAELAAAGLDGIEVDHPDHSPIDRERLRGLATELDLIPTGSSDYHGTNKTTSLGACTTAPGAYEAILAKATALDPIGAP
jgi:3',5'-nucleoside bisphosphate phosphatase